MERHQWIEAAKLTAEDAYTGDYFGYSVSISNNWISIGAPGRDDLGSSSGAVYLFNELVSPVVWPYGGYGGYTIYCEKYWIFKQKLTAPDGSSGDRNVNRLYGKTTELLDNPSFQTLYYITFGH